jgi:hypothetical protein
MRGPRGIFAVGLCVAIGHSAGCASTQGVRIACAPREVEIYVDGRLLEGTDDEIFLRTDEPHKIFVKAPGYEPLLVVLEPEVDAEGHPRFANELCIKPVAVGVGRSLELEVEGGEVPSEEPR